MSNKIKELKKHMRPGKVYRRADLQKWSKAVDRHLKQLQDQGTLVKLSGGLYLYPKNTVFGAAPAEDEKLVEKFLKDHRFLLCSPNAYNSLEVGTTQLYNETVVYNHKRHGCFVLGGRVFDFRVKPYFPQSLSKEFLFVDLLNNLNRLAENTSLILERVKEKIILMKDRNKLSRTVRDYGNVRTKKFFGEVFKENVFDYVL